MPNSLRAAMGRVIPKTGYATLFHEPQGRLEVRAGEFQLLKHAIRRSMAPSADPVCPDLPSENLPRGVMC